MRIAEADRENGDAEVAFIETLGQQVARVPDYVALEGDVGRAAGLEIRYVQAVIERTRRANDKFANRVFIHRNSHADGPMQLVNGRVGGDDKIARCSGQMELTAF